MLWGQEERRPQVLLFVRLEVVEAWFQVLLVVGWVSAQVLLVVMESLRLWA